MILVPVGVIWAGYTLVWYGWSMLRGPGIGISDLVIPGRVAATEQKLATLGQSGPDKPDAPPYTPGPGVQPGTPYYPPNPKGGLPSKPPLGGTPPAYYG